MTMNPDPALCVLIPASNEEALIGACLDALARSRGPDGRAEVIVIANGCRDATADVARQHAGRFAAKGWTLTVIERAEGGKLAALDAGEAQARAGIRVFLDADVTVSPDLLAQLHDALDTDAPRYASGTLRITAQGWAARAYARIYRQVPFMAQGVPGCGVFAVNAAGRAHWGAFPQIISDDTFVRLQFAPSERIAVPASYDWPLVEGLPAFAVTGPDGSIVDGGPAIAAGLPFTSQVDNLTASLTYECECGFSLSVWGRNLTDDRNLATVFDTPAQPESVSGYPNDPRTYGVTGRFRF